MSTENGSKPWMAVAVGVAAALGLITWWKKGKPLRKDKRRDAMFFMGPKESGKTTLANLYSKKRFVKEVVVTGVRPNSSVVPIGNKELCFFDAGGDFNFQEPNIKEICDQLKKQRPEYVVIVLTIDLSKLPWSELHKLDEKDEHGKVGTVEIVDKLGVYVSLLVSKIENEFKRPNWLQEKFLRDNFRENYDKGHWACSIVGTHRGVLPKSINESDVNSGLKMILDYFSESGHLGKLRAGSCKGFELNAKDAYKKLLDWTIEILSSLHGGEDYHE